MFVLTFRDFCVASVAAVLDCILLLLNALVVSGLVGFCCCCVLFVFV